MPAKQFVILAKGIAANNGGMAPLGARSELVGLLATCNVAPQTTGEDVLYGPGIRLELPPDQDPISQMLMTVVEEEIAWPVLVRLAQRFNWKVLDMDTGRELNA